MKNIRVWSRSRPNLVRAGVGSGTSGAPQKSGGSATFFTPCFAFFKGVMLKMNIRPNELTKTKFAHRRRSQKGPKFAN